MSARPRTSTRPRTSARRALKVLAVLTAGVLALSACSASDSSGSASVEDQVTFALDWVPNTNHIGVYVAEELGYFDEAGLDLEILPYGSTAATQLVSAGEADFGIGGQSNVQMARTAGLDLVSVYRVTQTDTGRLVTRGDDGVTRPADLDGLVFGGFGAPLYSALAASTIRGDGGKGTFKEVALDTGAYEALAQGRIDFTLSVATWEDLQAKLDKRSYRSFRYQDYGVPEQQSTGIVSSDAYLEKHPKQAAAFVQAVARGYAYAAKNPRRAADLLIKANPDTLGTAKDLVHRSAELMATDGYLVSSDREIGAADPEAWTEFGQFLVDGGFLTDSSGKVVTKTPDWSTYYTDEYLR